MKKILFTVFAAGIVSIIPVNAETHIDIMINNNYIKTDANPIIENNRVLAPVRSVANAFECDEIRWDEKDNSVYLSNNGNEVKMTVGNNYAMVNGKKRELNTKVKIYNDRTFIPVRFISEIFGADVSWDTKTYTVYINKEDILLKDEYIDESYTSDELEWLAKIIHAEAQGEPQTGKIGVGNVVLNRVGSKDFPNNIYDVIFDRKYGIQFTPVANGSIYNTPAKESYFAAKCALNGENIVGRSLYFCNPVISTNFWISNNRTFFTKIGKHEFYL